MTRRRATACSIALLAAAQAFAASAPPVTVHFQGEAGPLWRVEPLSRTLTVARGEVFETRVRVHNTSAQDVIAMVAKEVRPAQMASALIHLGCGPTFTVVLKPGEAVAVSSSYFVADQAAPEVSNFEIAYAVYSFEPYSREPLQLGRRIYAERCESCHGARGKGDGPTGWRLRGGVADLIPALGRRDDSSLLLSIASGVAAMPAFAAVLTNGEREALVVYLRALARSAP